MTEDSVVRMGMLEKFCDVKNTFEGKALAVFMSFVLAFSLVSLTSLASAAEDDLSGDAPVAAAADNTSGESGDPVETSAADPAEQPAPETTPAAPEATEPVQAEPEAPAITEPEVPVEDVKTVEPGVASIGLDFTHAYVKYLGQTISLPTETMNAPLNKELVFSAFGDTGYEIGIVKTVIGSIETELEADEETGEYKIPADQVTSNLVISVEAKAIEKEGGEFDSSESQSLTSENDANGAESEQTPSNESVAAFTNFSLRSASLDNVQVAVELIDAKGDVVKTDSASLRAGVIADRAPNYEGYSFKHALVDNNPIVYAGMRNGEIYYTAEGSMDSGIAMKLEAGKTIKLVYEPFTQKHVVSYSVEGTDDLDGNAFDGPETVKDGETLSFRVDVAYGYRVSVTSGGNEVPSNNYIYTIENVTDDVSVNIAYTKNDTFKFKVEERNSPNWHGAYFTSDGLYAVPADGETFSFRTKSPNTWSDFEYRLNAMIINDETIDVPEVNPSSLGIPGAPSYRPPIPTATTVLSSGVEVTVKLVGIEGTWPCQYEYEITLKGVKDDVTIKPGNFRASNWQEVMPRYTSGVDLEYSFYSANSASDVAGNGSFTAVRNYLPIATAGGTGQSSPWFRAKLMDGYENLNASIDGWGVLDDKNYTHAEVIGDWLYFQVIPVGSGTQDPRNLRNLLVSADLVQYSVSYNTNGGSLAPVDNASYDYNDNVQLMVAGAMPTNPGKIFLGWKLAGSEETYIPGQVLSIADVSAYADSGNMLMFTAQWADKAATGTPIPVQVNYYYMQEDGQYSDTPDKVTSVRGYAGTWIEKWNASDEAPSGLSFDAEHSTASAIVSGDPADPTILKLCYSAVALYSVTYDLAGGTTESPDISFTGIEEGADTPTIADPTRFGYTFAGWDPEVASTVTADVTYVAQWERDDTKTHALSYSVEYYKNGAIDNDISATFTKNVWVNATTIPVSDGDINVNDAFGPHYEFVSSDPTIIPAEVASGAVIKVYYQGAIDRLTYDGNEASSGSVEAAVGRVDEDVMVAQNGFERVGYTFDGWNTEADGSGAAYAPGANFTLTENDDVLYAQWKEALPVALIYQAEEGGKVTDGAGDAAVSWSEAVSPVTGSATGSTAQPSPGYRFAGWFADDVLVSEQALLDKAAVDAVARTAGVYVSTTFVAKFAESDEVTLTYVADEGGSVNRASETLAPATGTAEGSKAEPKPGYRFVKWTATAAEGTTVDASEDATLTLGAVDAIAKKSGAYENTTFTAHFEQESVIISYEATEGGSVSPERNEISAVDGGVIGSAAKADEHYYFAGWSVQGSDKIISTDNTITKSVVEQYAKNTEGTFMETTFVAHFAAMKKLTINSKSAKFTYNGRAQSAQDTEYDDNSVAISNLRACAEETNVGKYPVEFKNKDELIIKDIAGKDVTHQYEVTFVEGTLEITPRPIEVTGDGWGEPQEYTGSRYSKDTYQVEGFNYWGVERGLVYGHLARADYSISGIEPGEYEGVFDTINIVDASGNDVTFNYEITAIPGNLDIVASTQSLVITAASNSWKYDGATYSDGGYTVSYGGAPVARNEDDTYTLPTGDKVNATVSGAVTNVTDSLEGNNKIAGYEVQNAERYTNVAVVNGTLSITPRTVDLTSATATKPYDGTALTASDITESGDGWVAGEGAEYNVTGSQTAVASSENTFEYTLKDSTTAGNYTITKYPGTLTVTNRADDAKFEITVEANSLTDRYDGTAKSVSGLKQTQFTFGDATFTVTGLDASATETHAGTYGVNVTGTPVVTDEESNDVTRQFIVNTTDGSLVIEKRALTLESATLSKPYDGTPLTNNGADLKVEEGWADGEGATYEFTGSVLLAGETASNDFVVRPNEGTSLDNYKVTAKSGQLSIENRPEDIKYAVDVTANSGTFTYDGAEKQVSGFENETDRGIPVQADGRIYYVKGLESKAAGTNVADSTDSISVQGVARVFDEKNNDVSGQFKVTIHNGSLTIDKRDLMLESATLSKEYDGTPLVNGETPLVTNDGWANDEGATYEFTSSVTLAGKTEPNEFHIIPNAGTNLDNYNVTAKPGQLTILNRDALYEVTLTANSDTFTYDGVQKSIEGFEGEEDGVVAVSAGGKTYYVSGLTSTATGVRASTYQTTVGGTAVVRDAENNDVSSQFNVKTVVGSLTINKRPLMLESATLSKEYDGTPLVNGETPLAIEQGWADGEGATYEFTGSVLLAGQIEPNEFRIIPNADTSLDNYNVTQTAGSLTITNRNARYDVDVTANSDTFLYDGTEKQVLGFVNETDQGVRVEVGGRTYYVKGLESKATGTDAADSVSAIPITGTAVVFDEHNNEVSDQFNVSVNRGSLTIDKRDLTLKSATLSKEYDGTPLVNGETPLAIEQGWVDDEGATYTFTGSVKQPNETKPNAFTVMPKSGTNIDNYKLHKTEGQLTIKNRSDDAKYKIELEANSGTFTYSGGEQVVEGLRETEFTFDGFTYTVAGLEARAALADVGTAVVNLTGVPVVLDAENNEVTDQFDISLLPGTLTIEKRNVTLESATDEKPYDGTELTNHNVTVLGDGWAADEGADFDVTGIQTLVGFSNNKFTYTLMNGAKASNYNIDTREGTLTVTNRDVKYEATVTANSATFLYDGEEKTVSGFENKTDKGVAITAGEITYYVTGLTAGAQLTDAGTAVATVTGTPTVRDAEGNDVTSEFNIKPVAGSLTVEKRKVNVTSASATREYTGEELVAHDVIVSGDGWAANEGATYTYTGTQTIAGFSPNYFTATLNENTKATNYELNLIEGTLTVTPRDAAFNVTVKAVSDTVLYDGTEHVVSGFENETVQGIPVQAGGLTYYVTGVTANATGTDAGTFVARVDGTPVVRDAAGNDVSDQFAITVDPGKLVVSKRSVVLESASGSKPYDGTELTSHNVAVSGDGWAASEGADYQFTGAQTLVGTSDNVFDYVLNGGAKAENYQIEKRYGSLTVTNRDALYEATVTANSAKATYDGSEHAVSGFANETDKGVAVEVDGRTYYVSGYTATAAGTDAGTYSATVTGIPVVRDAEGNDVTNQFAITTQSGSLVIGQRPLTLTSANLSKTYDGRPLMNGFTPLAEEDGWVEGEGATYVFTGSVLLPGETAPNAFVIKAKDGTNLDNYTLSKTEGQLSVENRDAQYEATVTAQSGTFTYDGSEHAVSGFANETDKGVAVEVDGRTYYVSGLASRATGTNVADSVTTIPVAGVAVVRDADGNNVSSQFSVKVEVGSLTIVPAQLVITANDTGKRYGDGDPELTATVTGLVPGDTFVGTYDLARVAGENAGTYEIMVSNVQLGERSNYSATTAPGRFIIAPAGEVTLVVADGSKPYDGTPLTPSGFNPIGLAPGDTVEVVYGGSQTDAGTGESTITDYVIRNADGDDVTANYPTVNVEPGTLLVDPAQAVITVDDATKVAGTDDPTFTGTVEGLVADGDLGEISFSRTNTDEEADVYTDVITATFVANPNYTVTVVPGTFTITAATPVTPPAPVNPVTPTPTPTPAPTPAPLPTPGTPPTDNPVTAFVAPVADALQNAVETVIGANETPLAGFEAEEKTIEDDGTPLAGFNTVNCWVHYYLILGIVLTVLYGSVVVLRRMRYTHQLKKFENDVLGVEDKQQSLSDMTPLTTKGQEA